MLFHMLFGYLIVRALLIVVKVFGYARMGRKLDPFFTDVMTLADVYHYATQLFDFHGSQLTLDQTCPMDRG